MIHDGPANRVSRGPDADRAQQPVVGAVEPVVLCGSNLIDPLVMHIEARRAFKTRNEKTAKHEPGASHLLEIASAPVAAAPRPGCRQRPDRDTRPLAVYALAATGCR